MNRVVITGAGIWSCLGTSLEEVSKSLRDGKSGIVLEDARVEYGYRSGLTAKVPEVELKPYIDRRTRVSFGQEASFAYMAARQALEQAGITNEVMEQEEMGLIFGNDSAAKSVIEASKIIENRRDTQMVGRGAVFQCMNSTVSMNLGQVFPIRGINMTVSAACASSSHSVGLSYLLIRDGLQQMVLCGGAQEVNLYAMGTFDAIAAFSTRMDEPTKASRPFDKNRDGLVPGGGAAALVLESYDHAVARGANILAEIVGYGFSSNGGGGISHPGVEGSMTAMQRALDMAGLSADDVDYINAHATSTPQGDAIEAEALSRMFGGKKAWVSSTKSMTGHECWMAGTSEVVYSLLMMQGGFIAPNINLEEPCDEAAGLNLAAHTIETDVNTVLSNSFGFGGTNSALVIKKI